MLAWANLLAISATSFFMSYTFTSNTWPKLAKVRQKPSNTLRLNIVSLNIVSDYLRKKMIGHTQNMSKKQVSALMKLCDQL